MMVHPPKFAAHGTGWGYESATTQPDGFPAPPHASPGPLIQNGWYTIPTTAGSKSASSTRSRSSRLSYPTNEPVVTVRNQVRARPTGAHPLATRGETALEKDSYWFGDHHARRF